MDAMAVWSIALLAIGGLGAVVWNARSLKRYAASIQARHDGSAYSDHGLVLIEAPSLNEARNLALAAALHRWPQKEGWTHHSVIVQEHS